jgi:hypothetical protein
MIVPSEIQRRYDEIFPYLKILRDRVEGILLSYCRERGLAFLARTKTLESLAEKIESGRFSKWSDLDDLVARAIVIPTLSMEADVTSFLQKTFDQISLKLRGTTNKPPDAFRFDSTRFIGRLKKIEGIELAPQLHGISFEIQIRSAFEHAWSSATHAIYKSSKVNWKQLRLQAQLKAVVEQLDNLILSFETSAEQILEFQWLDTQLKALIIARFEQWVSDGIVPTEFRPKDWSRFADNLYSLLRASDSHPRDLKSFVIEALTNLENKFKELGTKTFPRSLSLFQLSFAILCEANVVRTPLHDFNPVITSELTELYPSIKAHTRQFQFNS